MPPVKRARVIGFSNAAVLGELLEQFVREALEAGKALKDVFALHAYTDLALNATPDGPSLAALEAVVALLLQAAPSASINQRAFEQALKRTAEKRSGLVPGKVTAEMWAGHVAQQLRIACSHLRRMRLNSVLRRQRLAVCTPQEQDAVNSLLDLIVADGEEESMAGASSEGLPATAESPPAGTGAAGSGLPEAAAGTGTGTAPRAAAGGSAEAGARRSLGKRVSDVSAASLDFDSLAASPKRRLVIPAFDCGLLLSALAMTPRPAESGAQGRETKDQKTVLRKPAASSAATGASSSALEASSAGKAAGASSASAASRTAAVPRGIAEYNTMYYKTSGAVAVREKGGRQVLQILVAGASRAALQKIADEAVAKLTGGEALLAVKQWVLEAKSELAGKAARK
jgi:hypothetical protein